MGYATPATRSVGNVIGATQWNELVMNDRWLAETSTDGAPFCRAHRSTTQAIAHNTSTAVSWNTNDADNAGIHSTVVNPTRFTATVSGWYLMIAQLGWDANSSGSRAVQIVPNGTGVVDGGSNTLAMGIFGIQQGCVSILHLTAGMYAEVVGYQSSGGSLNLLSGQSTYAFFKWIAGY